MIHHHNYKLISDTSEAMVEVCIECKHKNIIKKDSKGRIDNNKYLQDHQRDTAQPTGPTAKIFERYYGKAKK